MRPAPSKMQQELLEEHLGEATFLWTSWESALDSSAFTLAELAEGPEERLLAHLDALVLGGPSASQKLLHPGLAQGEGDIVTASALALLSTGDAGQEARVLEALEQGEAEARPWLRRALELGASPRCLESLSRLLSSPEVDLQSSALQVLVFWRNVPGAVLKDLLTHRAPEVLGPALRAARITEEPFSEDGIIKALDSPDATVRDEALLTALTLGIGSAWHLCRQLAAGPSPNRTALLLLGLGGTDSDLNRLLETSGSSSSGADAVWALGFSGRREAAECCLELLSHEALGKLAAEAFCAITGLSLEGPYRREPPGDEALDEDSDELVLPGPEDKLPVAEPAAVHRWWQTHRGQFERGVRYLLGKPLTAAWLAESLEHVPMRRRHVLAQELALRSRGRLVLQTRSFSARQRAEFQEAQESLGRLHLSRPFSELVATARPPPRAPKAQHGPSVIRPRQGSRPAAGQLAVTGLGMVSALGDGVIAGCAASRAGLSRLRALEDVQVWDPESRQPEPARVVAIPWVTEGFSGIGRLAALATEALLDLRAQTGFEPGPRCALYLTAPGDYYRQHLEEREGAGSRLHEERRATYQQRLLPTILRTAGLPATLKVQPLLFGEVGFVLALQDALRQFDEGTIDACIVGGVDSLVESQLISALDQLRLLKTPGNPVGFLPGEASAFVLIERWDAAVRRGARVMATLEAPCHETEPFHRLSRTPAQGEALARCIRQTLDTLPARREQAQWVIASLNGDDYRAADWGHAIVALQATGHLGDAPAWYPAASFGEIGAATGPTSVCMAVRGFERGYLRKSSVLLWLSSDDGSRGSLHLRPS
ncbi:TIGR02270 family protein [Archangium violaceum]|uniref:TIGR02270 family protein n=1 Tax=Archangium violaceum TaxID=83451 RepID=UPI0036D947DE